MSVKQNKFSKKDLLEIAEGVFSGLKNGKLPKPPLLMLDRILHISKDGGKYNKGSIVAEMDIDKNHWFFKCHFINDPVMPGCLGLDGFWQLIGFFLSWIGGAGRGRALGVGEVKFKGQVRPYHDKIIYKIDIKKVVQRPMFIAWGDAELSVKDRVIYFAKNLQVGLFENLTWDFGSDPALDSF
jgi:3-hydroxyacyl-[acyl-carrier protein] dehydratase/trans-2-decenoyl-[acyl-carrier protein] isomerase